MSGCGCGGGFPTRKSLSQLTMEILKGGGDTCLSPMTQCSTFPFLILWNHAPSQFSCSEHSWLGYLIKMCVYMMPQFNICRMSRYTIGDNSKSET